MDGSPPSSPGVASTPPSSPARAGSSPASPVTSPVRSAPPSSPLVLLSVTSSDEEQDIQVQKRRKKYEYFEPEVPFSPAFWKHEEKQGVTGTKILEVPDVMHEYIPPVSSGIIEEDLLDNANYANAEGEIDLTGSSSSGQSSASSIIVHSSSDESSCAPDSDISDCSAAEESELEEDNTDSDSSDSDDNLFSPPVYQGCPLSVDEGVLELMDLFVKRKMEKVEISAILKSVLKFIPKYNHFPRTQHTLFQYVEKLSPVSTERTHYYCSVCLFYLGEADQDCHLCGGASHTFYQLSLADQIRNLFEYHGLAEAIQKYSEERETLSLDGSYHDICDGSEFKRSYISGPFNLVLQAHTDGISVSDSSNTSLWPFEYVIANLPPHLRFKYVIINGIWLDTCKPNLNSYLRPGSSENTISESCYSISTKFCGINKHVSKNIVTKAQVIISNGS